MKKNGNFKVIVILVLFIVFSLSLSSETKLPTENYSLRCRKQMAATLVHSTATGLSELLKDVSGEQERIKLIQTFVGKIRFYSDNSGYLFVNGYNCVNIAYPLDSNLQGKNLYDHQDIKGKYTFREGAAIARKGGGFLEYYWIFPGTEKEQKKISYIEPIPGTDYWIGAGIYLNDDSE
ncbi:MAG: cache domain-containing protein [Armatimonadetes bacterium]|nr:cache domain-containing protein [Armatimonadota bacterium]